MYKSKLLLCFSGCVFYEILFSKKAFTVGRRSLLNNISQGKYEPIPEALVIQYGDIIASLLSVDPRSRFNASMVVESLESHGKCKTFSDTLVVTQNTKTHSTGNIHGESHQVEGQERTRNANHAEFQSFGVAWDYAAELRFSDIEKGWNIGQCEVSAPSFRPEKAKETSGSVSKKSKRFIGLIFSLSLTYSIFRTEKLIDNINIDNMYV